MRALAERAHHPRAVLAVPTAGNAQSEKQAAVSRLIQIYTNRGHLIAKVDPLGMMQRTRPRVLELDYMGLTEADLDTAFFTASRVEAVPRRAPLREIIALLENVFAGPIGAEFAHVSDSDERLWLQDEFLRGRTQLKLEVEDRLNILRQLTAAEGLERYLHTKYVGQKRFSLEGGDALIPDARRSGAARGRGRSRGDRHRHGAPRSPERAGERAGQSPLTAVLGIRRQVRALAPAGLR